MEEYILIRPTIKYAHQIAEYRQEFLDTGDSMDGCGPLRRIEDPNEYIKICCKYEDHNTVPAHLVPATQFLFVRKSDDRLLGMIQVRHCFNEYLENTQDISVIQFARANAARVMQRRCSKWLCPFARN